MSRFVVGAYDIYLARNGNPGDPLQDCLRAKEELTAKLARQQRH